jgi:hypothetical protein
MYCSVVICEDRWHVALGKELLRIFEEHATAMVHMEVL